MEPLMTVKTTVEFSPTDLMAIVDAYLREHYGREYSKYTFKVEEKLIGEGMSERPITRFEGLTVVLGPKIIPKGPFGQKRQKGYTETPDEIIARTNFGDANN